MNEAQQAHVDAYLARLRRSLGVIPPEDVNEILREIRSHILERAEARDPLTDAALAQVLTELGSPEEIGPHYQTEALVTRARSSFSPGLILATTLRWAMKSFVGFMALLFGLFGYGLAFGFLFCAVAKPFRPSDVGLWITESGAVLGTSDLPAATEVLGWWIIPIGLQAGALALIVTTLVLRYLLKFAIGAKTRDTLLRVGASARRIFDPSVPTPR
jgi:uncharacterized membrane protein